MPLKDPQILSYHPETRAEWRNWLAKNYAVLNGVWLVLIKKGADIAGIMYNDAVEEALCFGWIDSNLATLDEQLYKLYFPPGNRKASGPGSISSEYKNSSGRGL